MFYRSADAAILGRSNTGNEHRIQVRTIENTALAGLMPRHASDEHRYGGFVTDYFWSDNDQTIWGKVREGNVQDQISKLHLLTTIHPLQASYKKRLNSSNSFQGLS